MYQNTQIELVLLGRRRLEASGSSCAFLRHEFWPPKGYWQGMLPLRWLSRTQSDDVTLEGWREDEYVWCYGHYGCAGMMCCSGRGCYLRTEWSMMWRDSWCPGFTVPHWGLRDLLSLAEEWASIMLIIFNEFQYNLT